MISTFWKRKKKAFTMVEIVLVIAIAAIIATVTLNMNRWRIQQMQNINERELRLDRHTHINREITNTNFFKGVKIQSLNYQYLDNTTTILLSGVTQWWNPQAFTPFTFRYHTLISGSVIVTKIPLQLWCTLSWSNSSDKIYLQAKSDKIFCFKLNPSLCSWSLCN